MSNAHQSLPIVACDVHAPVLRRSLEEDCDFTEALFAEIEASVHCFDCLFLLALITQDSSCLLEEFTNYDS